LQQLLVELRRARDTQLQFQIDSPSIAMAVWNRFWPLLGDDERGTFSDGLMLCRGLDELLDRLLDIGAEPGAGDDFGLEGRIALAERCRPAATDAGPLPMLAMWFDAFCGAMRTANDSTIAAMALLVEGYDARDVAQQLDLGVRLVRRLAGQARALLSKAKPAG
jgi:hypothetical protein